jgi:hypothetical protein
LSNPSLAARYVNWIRRSTEGPFVCSSCSRDGPRPREMSWKRQRGTGQTKGLRAPTMSVSIFLHLVVSRRLLVREIKDSLETDEAEARTHDESAEEVRECEEGVVVGRFAPGCHWIGWKL